ncbi:MAG: GNAT family N-acetyltransferase [Chloroflexi bacterium]|nr:MAG: GNAT family N-acetyltransferase [Chloroflexota bacterium]
MITLRNLHLDELGRIGEIDRSEPVTLVYRVDDGVLVSEAIDSEAERWSAERVAGYVRDLVRVLESGGLCFGAENSAEGGRLAGVASLGAERVETRPSMLELKFMHVSRPYRRHGVAGRLLERVESEARRRGAEGLYISATPTASAVGFYLSRGATLLVPPDPALLAAEPEDIHLGLPLRR